jgi:copper(I)-binding protein
MKHALSLLAAASLAVAVPAIAHEIGAGALNIVHPWARPAAAGMNGALYVKVTNAGA